MRSIGVGYLLWFFFGVLGAHRFYCGRVVTGILWALTGGICGIGWLVDAFLIPSMVDEANREFTSYTSRVAPHGRSSHSVSEYPSPETRFGKPVPAPESPGITAGRKVVFCTACGSPMQVPADAFGASFACPACHTVLTVPA